MILGRGEHCSYGDTYLVPGLNIPGLVSKPRCSIVFTTSIHAYSIVNLRPQYRRREREVCKVYASQCSSRSREPRLISADVRCRKYEMQIEQRLFFQEIEEWR
jgi:hypothetical protein